MINDKIISTKSLTIKFSSKTILSNINLNFNLGEFIVIIGKNGSGKSTLLNQISGINKPTSGDVFIQNYNTKTLNNKIRAKIVSSIGQFDTSNDDVFVEERIAHGLASQYGINSLLNYKILKKIYTIGKTLKILHLFGKHLNKLSGGERKLTHIARCIINERALVYILDEPFTSLDIPYRKLLYTLLKKKHKVINALFYLHMIYI